MMEQHVIYIGEVRGEEVLRTISLSKLKIARRNLPSSPTKNSENRKTMAESIWSSAKMLATLLIKEGAFLHKVKNEVKSLADKLEGISSHLKEANVMTDREEEFDRWVNQLRDLGFKAEDVIEVFANNATPCDGCNIFQLIMGCFCQIATLHKLKREMDSINNELERLLGKRPEMKIRRPEDSDIENLASSNSNEDDIIGFEGEAAILTSTLTEEEPRGELFVFSIWAQGGAGKTALAQKIYKSSSVKSHFDCVAFVSVSPNYVVKDIWLAILAQVKKLTKKEEEELQSEKDVVVQFLVLNYLKEKNSLIILDDLWKVDDLYIMEAFPKCPQKKCRVLLTTRMEDVARGANPSIEPINLRLLNGDESMQLFLKKVYRCSLGKIPRLYKEMDREMKDLASQMLAKCEGLPIAIVLLGSILSYKRKDPRVWRNKLDRVCSDLANERGLQKVFALSYNELPYQLRSCFLYFGLFPEDSVIDCDKLIRLWVAEGFLEQSVNGTMEEVAGECFDGLIQRSMIQVVERRSNGDPQTCRTHDLIRDLVMQEAKKTKFSSIFKEEHLGSVEGSRRIVLHHKDHNQFHGTSTDTHLSNASSLSYPISSSQTSRMRPRVVEDIDLVGFQKEADELVTLLTKVQPLGQVCAVSVVGNEGAGKTALARNVYNRSDVKSQFACRAWVYVHPMMELKNFLQIILQQVMMLTYVESNLEEEELERMLHNHLEGKSYLIVLDYLFEGEEDWNVIKSIFPKPLEDQKCRVLLTTYSQTVAYLAFGSTDSIWLWHLHEEESLKLFLKTVFQCSQDEIAEVSPSKYMINTARSIVQKCGGLPLAISLLAGLLSVKRKHHSVWADVLESFSQRRKNKSVIQQVAVLCYEDLPDYLRSCIRAFTVIQMYAAIQYDALIQLWVAQGFLNSRDNKSMEEVARDCLEELIQRKLIQVSTWTLNGYPETCRIHNLIRDLAIGEEANKAEFSNSTSLYNQLGLVELGGILDSELHVTGTSTAAPPPSFQPKTFSLSHLPSFLDPFKFLEFQNHVYSFLCFSKKPQFRIERFNLVRVLDLEGAENVTEVPKKIRNLTLLRYLSLRGTRVKLIPPWIAYLRNLQTLDAPGSKIPIDTLKLNKLRHLFAHSFYPTDMSRPIDSYSLNFTTLQHLHTLELDIGDWVTSGLEELTNLRVLRLHGCNRIELIKAIANLTRLKILSLTQAAETFAVHLPSFTYHRHLDEMVLKMRIIELPTANDFPAHLTYLWLEYYIDNEVDPISTLQELPYLKRLRLRLINGSNFGDVRMNCSAGRFPELEDLCISVRCRLQHWTVEQEAMRSLRVLRIEGGYRLGKLPDGLKHLPKLKELIITGGADVKNSLVDRREEWDKFKEKRPYIKYMDDTTISLQMETVA